MTRSDLIAACSVLSFAGSISSKCMSGFPEASITFEKRTVLTTRGSYLVREIRSQSQCLPLVDGLRKISELFSGYIHSDLAKYKIARRLVGLNDSDDRFCSPNGVARLFPAALSDLVAARTSSVLIVGYRPFGCYQRAACPVRAERAGLDSRYPYTQR